MTLIDSRLDRRPWRSGHRYYLDGENVPGVTTVMGALGSSPDGLMHWAAKAAADYTLGNFERLMMMQDHDSRLMAAARAHKALNEAAKAQGTLIHELVVPLLYGEPPADARQFGDPVVRTKLAAAQKLIREWQLQPVLTETMVFHEELRYAGTFDLVATTPLYPGRVFLCDWKSNNSGIYPETGLQLAAYAGATHYVDPVLGDVPMEELGITDTVALWLQPFEGTVQWTNSLDPAVWAYWVQVLGTYEAKRDTHKKLLGPALTAPETAVAS